MRSSRGANSSRRTPSTSRTWTSDRPASGLTSYRMCIDIWNQRPIPADFRKCAIVRAARQVAKQRGIRRRPDHWRQDPSLARLVCDERSRSRSGARKLENSRARRRARRALFSVGFFDGQMNDDGNLTDPGGLAQTMTDLRAQALRSTIRSAGQGVGVGAGVGAASDADAGAGVATATAASAASAASAGFAFAIGITKLAGY